MADLFARCASEYGRIDVLFNNAGISPTDDASVLDTSLEAWQRVQDVNLKSVFLCCKHGIPHLIEGGGGSVINTASFVATMGSATSQISYTASKGGVLSLSRELGRRVRASGRAGQRALPRPGQHAAAAGAVRQGPGRGRAAPGARPAPAASPRCSEIANAVLFLASDDSSYVNATQFMVDGGIHRPTRRRNNDDRARLRSPWTVFAPVRSQTAFEETLDRLGTAIKLGLLEPGRAAPRARAVPPTGHLRSTLHQALTALVQSGHLAPPRAQRRHLVADSPPPASAPAPGCWRGWRNPAISGWGSSSPSVLAAERAPATRSRARRPQRGDGRRARDFGAFRHADVRWHICLAEARRGRRLLVAMTEAQGQMSDLIAYIAHPPELLAWSNERHRKFAGAMRSRDAPRRYG